MSSAGALSDPDLHELVLHRVDGWPAGPMVRTADAVRRLTDPAGVGDDVLAGVAELYRRRAYREPDGEAFRWWALMDEMLDMAPDREAEFLGGVCVHVADDPTALNELLRSSALSQNAVRGR
jgi:hypothetical protein